MNAPAHQSLGEIWVYLSASPLLGLTLTLLAYQGAVLINRRCGGHPLANPVLIAVCLLGALLWLTATPYATYFEGAQFVHFLLGPATVCLALPLADNLPRLSGPADQSAQLLAMYRQLTPEFEPLDAAVEQLELTDRGSWRVQLDSGTTIELGRGTSAEVIERTRSYVRTVPRATANYGRKPDAVESADLRHVSGYAMRLRGVTTVTGTLFSR